MINDSLPDAFDDLLQYYEGRSSRVQTLEHINAELNILGDTIYAEIYVNRHHTRMYNTIIAARNGLANNRANYDLLYMIGRDLIWINELTYIEIICEIF